MLFRQIVFYALLVGFAAGLALTLVQSVQVVPIIISAENFEQQETAAAVMTADHAHAHAAHDHHHDTSAWAPGDGLERTFFTLISNVLTAIGFALFMLVAMMATVKSPDSPKLGWQYGLMWGAAGYIVFFLAPALGMPPEIPGAAAASLEDRQTWWLLAVGLTAIGLAGTAYFQSWWRWSFLALLAVPHLVGAPHVEGPMFAGQPTEAASQLSQLASQFVSATALANATLWVVIGLVSIWSVKRIALAQAHREKTI